MDAFYILCNSLGVFVLIVIYIGTLMPLVSSDNDLSWMPCITILSSILTYISYLLLADIVSSKLLQIAFGVLNLLTAICLLVGILRRKRQSIIPVFIGIIGLGVFGGIPILSFSCKVIRLSVPYIEYNTETIVVGIILFTTICTTIMLTYLVVKSKNAFAESTHVLNTIGEEFRKKTFALNSFYEPYVKYIRDDVKSELYRLFRDFKDEMTVNAFFSKKSNRDNGMQNMIYHELNEIKKQLEHSEQRLPFSFAELVSNIKHSITTPLSQIQSNCELLKSSSNTESKEDIVNSIEDATKVCLSIIHSYVEASNTISIPAFLDIKNGVRAYFNMLKNLECSHVDLVIKEMPETFEGYSGNFIYALIVPLLQNAIAASPNGGTIYIDSNEDKVFYKINMTNSCLGTPPDLQKLNKPGYSSKVNHDGVGLQTVRNLLSLIKTGHLSFAIEKENVTATIQLKKRHNG